MQFPVWARAVHAKGTVKATVGSVNTPIICAGALVHPGDVVIGDDDGVVVVPKAHAARVAAAAATREEKEAVTRQRLASGELGLDVYGMRESLAKAGLKYFANEADYEGKAAK
jgi:4-hydroxy-4-methyl-2-oxoglutarate aldolase